MFFSLSRFKKNFLLNTFITLKYNWKVQRIVEICNTKTSCMYFYYQKISFDRRKNTIYLMNSNRAYVNFQPSNFSVFRQNFYFFESKNDFATTRREKIETRFLRWRVFNWRRERSHARISVETTRKTAFPIYFPPPLSLSIYLSPSRPFYKGLHFSCSLQWRIDFSYRDSSPILDLTVAWRLSISRTTYRYQYDPRDANASTLCGYQRRIPRATSDRRISEKI